MSEKKKEESGIFGASGARATRGKSARRQDRSSISDARVEESLGTEDECSVHPTTSSSMACVPVEETPRDGCYICRGAIGTLKKCSRCPNLLHERCRGDKDEEDLLCAECSLFSVHEERPPLRGLYLESPERRTQVAADRYPIFQELDEKGMSVLSMNINGLRGKLDALRVSVMVRKPAVVALQETKLNSSVTNRELALEGYRLFRKDRTSNGGGVALYVTLGLKSKRLSTAASDYEGIFVRCWTKRKSFIAASVYRSPTGMMTQERISEFVDSFESTLCEFDEEHENLIICGDLNIGWSTDEDVSLRRVCEEHSLVQLVTERTHKNRVIDLAIVSQRVSVTRVELLAPLEKEHCPVLVVLSLPRVKVTLEPISVWSYKKANWQKLKEELRGRALSHGVRGAADVDEAAEWWTEQVMSAVRLYIPRAKFRPRTECQWVSQQAKQLSLEKDRAHHEWRLDPTPSKESSWRNLKKRLAKTVQQDKLKYFADLFPAKQEPIDFWSSVRKATGQNAQAEIPALEKSDGSLVSTNKEKADLLVEQFHSVFTRSGCATTEFLIREESWRPRPYAVDHVLSYIDKQPVKKACGGDGIPMRIFKECKEEISESIALLVNRCINEERFPQSWKEAVVAPIPKEEGSNRASDYRPISLLPIVSKITEAHVYEMLVQFVEPQLSDLQFGFRKGRSTVDALSAFQIAVSRGFEYCERSRKACHVAGLFCDVQKAFDTVPFNKLVQVLHEEFHVPASLLRFLSSYLSGRMMRVRVGEELSEAKEVLSGVPQGSILGPLLFIAYIDRLGKMSYSDNARAILYADDLVYLKPIVSEADRSAFMADVEKIEQAFTSLDLKLNAKKCKLMHFRLSTKPELPVFDVQIAGCPLEIVDEYKYLGIVLDPELTFREHCQRTVTRARKAIGALTRTMRKWAPRSAFGRVYRGTIESFLLYGMDSCYPSQVGLQNSLERTHRLAARLAANDFRSDYSTVLDKLHWKRLQELALERSLTLCWSYVHGQRHLPNGFLCLRREENSLRRSQRTGHGAQIILTTSKKSHVCDMPINRSLRLWNRLSEEQANAESKRAFKTALVSGGAYTRLRALGEIRPLKE